MVDPVDTIYLIQFKPFSANDCGRGVLGSKLQYGTMVVMTTATAKYMPVTINRVIMILRGTFLSLRLHCMNLTFEAWMLIQILEFCILPEAQMASKPLGVKWIELVDRKARELRGELFNHQCMRQNTWHFRLWSQRSRMERSHLSLFLQDRCMYDWTKHSRWRWLAFPSRDIGQIHYELNFSFEIYLLEWPSSWNRLWWHRRRLSGWWWSHWRWRGSWSAMMTPLSLSAVWLRLRRRSVRWCKIRM